MTQESSTYVVIGAGLAGAATAWRLAAEGHEVTVLERADPANPDGSSHGSARIFRYAYPDRLYAELVVRARPLWEQIERETGTALLSTTGALDTGAQRGTRLLADVLTAVGVEHELLSAREAAARFPMMTFDSEALWHPQAGVLDAENGVRAMLDLARRHGARLETDWELADASRTAAGFTLTSTTGARVDAGHLIVCAGGWLPDLVDVLPLSARARVSMPELTVRQEQVFHFPYRPDVAPAEAWPTFIHKSPAIQAYGLPGGRDAGFAGQKVAEFNGGHRIASARAQDHRIDPRSRERVASFVRATLPGVEPEPYAETTCLFTSTPTEDFILDTQDAVTVVSPCSGHGAKVAPVIGGLAAGLATGTGTGTVPDAFRVFPAVLRGAFC